MITRVKAQGSVPQPSWASFFWLHTKCLSRCPWCCEVPVLPGASSVTSWTSHLASLSLSIFTYRTRLRGSSSQGYGWSESDGWHVPPHLGICKMFFNCCQLALSSDKIHWALNSEAFLFLLNCTIPKGLPAPQHQLGSSNSIRANLWQGCLRTISPMPRRHGAGFPVRVCLPGSEREPYPHAQAPSHFPFKDIFPSIVVQRRWMMKPAGCL